MIEGMSRARGIWAGCLVVLLMAWTGLARAGLPEALADPGRTEQDRARDANGDPVAIMEFLGIKPGMVVLDVLAAGGYFSELLSWTLGAEGKVYAQNTKFLLAMGDGMVEKALAARLANGRLGNVERLDRELGDLGIAPASLDAATVVMNYHDIANQEAGAGEAFLQGLAALLKPGGVIGLIDHVGAAGKDNAALHRIETAKVIDAVKAAGLVLEAESSLLANPADDHTLGVFDPAIRGKTDRFLMRIRKPQ